MAKAKRRRLAAIEKQNKTLASDDVLPPIPASGKDLGISDLPETQKRQIEYRKQRVIVLIPPLPLKKVKELHGRAHQKPRKTYSKVPDVEANQAPAAKSVDKSSGSLKLILKHGAWRREKLIGQVQLPGKDGASKVTEKLVGQVQLPENNGASKVTERRMGRRVKSQKKAIDYPMQEIKLNEITNSKSPDREIADALMLPEIQETPAPNLPKEDSSEPQIHSKLVDPVSGVCSEMDKTGSLKAIDFIKDPLPADITCRDALDDGDQKIEEKSTSLQGKLDKMREDGNRLGQNFISEQKEEQRVYSQQLVNIPDTVTPGGWVSTHLKSIDILQLNLHTHNTGNSKDTRFNRNYVAQSELVTLCPMKPGFPSIHGIIFEKKEDKVNLVQQKLDKAGGLQKWLIKSGLGQFVKIFQEKNVEIPELLDLNMGALKQMGAAAVGPRRKLIHAIDSLF